MTPGHRTFPLSITARVWRSAGKHSFTVPIQRHRGTLFTAVPVIVASLGLDGCEVRLCDPCVRVCACVSRVCVPAPPGVFLPVILVHVLVFRVLVRVQGGA